MLEIAEKEIFRMNEWIQKYETSEVQKKNKSAEIIRKSKIVRRVQTDSVEKNDQENEIWLAPNHGCARNLINEKNKWNEKFYEKEETKRRKMAYELPKRKPKTNLIFIVRFCVFIVFIVRFLCFKIFVVLVLCFVIFIEKFLCYTVKSKFERV